MFTAETMFFIYKKRGFKNTCARVPFLVKLQGGGFQLY